MDAFKSTSPAFSREHCHAVEAGGRLGTLHQAASKSATKANQTSRAFEIGKP